MNRSILSFLSWAVLSSSLVACSGEAESPSAEHAPATVTPGSHEDWCGEHEVPESLCTRCNPDLRIERPSR